MHFVMSMSYLQKERAQILLQKRGERERERGREGALWAVTRGGAAAVTVLSGGSHPPVPPPRW